MKELLNFELVDLSEITNSYKDFDPPPACGGCGGWFGRCDSGGCGGSFGLCGGDID